MTYEIPLSTASLGTGLVLATSSLPGLLMAESVRQFLLKLPRSFTAGVVMLIASALWVLWLLSFVLDLGEFTPQRGNMILLVLALAIATAVFLPDFLFCRAWGIFLLLSTEILLSACFPHDTPWKLVLVVMAYSWAVCGLVFVCAPYTLRNLLERWNSSSTMTRISSSLNLLLGLLLIILSQTAFLGK